jgi:hypothetical protein
MANKAHSVISEQHKVVVLQRVGRLGNQIALMSNLVAFSQATGVIILHPTLGAYADYFRGTCCDLFCRYPAVNSSKRRVPILYRMLLYSVFRAFDRSGAANKMYPGRVWESDYKTQLDLASPEFLTRVRSARYTFLTKGWFFRYPDVDKTSFLADLGSFFSLAEPYASRVAAVLRKAKSMSDILIGVHIRQSDFRDHAGGKYFHSTKDYARLMEHTCRLFPGQNVDFLVVSDEPKSAFDFPGLRCHFGSGQDVEDMYSLGGCDYIIGSAASSFSLWPAVLFQRPTYRILDPACKPTKDDFRITLEPWAERGKSSSA